RSEGNVAGIGVVAVVVRRIEQRDVDPQRGGRGAKRVGLDEETLPFVSPASAAPLERDRVDGTLLAREPRELRIAARQPKEVSEVRAIEASRLAVLERDERSSLEVAAARVAFRLAMRHEHEELGLVSAGLRLGVFASGGARRFAGVDRTLRDP